MEAQKMKYKSNSIKNCNLIDKTTMPNALNVFKNNIPNICTSRIVDSNFPQPSNFRATVPKDGSVTSGTKPKRGASFVVRAVKKGIMSRKQGASIVERDILLAVYRVINFFFPLAVCLNIHRGVQPGDLFIDLEYLASFLSLLVQTKELISPARDGAHFLPAVLSPTGSVMYWLFVFPHLGQTLSVSVLFLHSSIWIFTWLEFFVSNRRVNVYRDILILLLFHACWVLTNLIVVRYFTESSSLYYYKVEGPITHASLQNIRYTSNVIWCLELVSLMCLYISVSVINVLKPKTVKKKLSSVKIIIHL